MNLHELPVGGSGIIMKVGGNGALRNRLLDMGLTPRTEVKKIKVAPMGNPMQIALRGYQLTLLNEDAEMIELEEYR